MATAVIIITDDDTIEGGVRIKLRYDESLDKNVLLDPDSPAHLFATQILKSIDEQYNSEVPDDDHDETDLDFNQPVHPTIQ